MVEIQKGIDGIFALLSAITRLHDFGSRRWWSNGIAYGFRRKSGRFEANKSELIVKPGEVVIYSDFDPGPHAGVKWVPVVRDCVEVGRGVELLRFVNT
jgi:hypothetical protein